MTQGLKFWSAGLGFLGLGVGVGMCVHRTRWNRKTRTFTERLTEPDFSPEPQRVTFEHFDRLPEPVAQYLRRVLQEGKPMIHSVRLQQVGDLRGLEESQGRWVPFKAMEFFSAGRPGFLWDAHLRASAWMPIQVRDFYIAGQGGGAVSALSLVTIADESGTPELAQGALLRYLAEAVWLPTALLPSARLRWSPIDHNKAQATLTDAGTTVSLEFQFNDFGEVIAVYTPSRYRAVGGTYELTPWGGRHRAYEERQGMWVPTEGEVEWHLPEGTMSVWKGKIVQADYKMRESIL